MSPRIRLALLALVACGRTAADDTDETRLAIVRGSVTLVEGDCMPGSDPASCRVSVPAELVEAFPVIEFAEGESPDAPTGAPVATQRTAADGTFEMTLPEGRYTLLVRDGEAWFPPSGAGPEWAPVEVNHGWVETVQITLGHSTF